MKLAIEYPAGHTSTESWGPTDDMFCPKCGTKSVWNADVGDYYVGEQHICITCRHTFYLPGGVQDCRGREDVQRINQLLGFGRQT